MRLNGRDLPVFEQDVVQRQGDLAVHRRPIVGIGRLDEDVPIEAHLLAVVLADVRVVPVDAGIRERDPIGEGSPNGNRRLGFVGAVIAVLESQAVPVHGCFHLGVVGDVDGDFGAFADAQGRAWDGAVVGEHAHRVVSELLDDGRDPQVDGVAAGEVDHVGLDGGWQPRDCC